MRGQGGVFGDVVNDTGNKTFIWIRILKGDDERQVMSACTPKGERSICLPALIVMGEDSIVATR